MRINKTQLAGPKKTLGQWQFLNSGQDSVCNLSTNSSIILGGDISADVAL